MRQLLKLSHTLLDIKSKTKVLFLYASTKAKFNLSNRMCKLKVFYVLI